jgi:hypothetical protein
MVNGIEFNDEQQNQNPRFLYSRLQVSPDKPGVVNYLINHKIVKNENGANLFLVGITILFFALSIVLFMYASGSFDKTVKSSVDSRDPFNRLNK